MNYSIAKYKGNQSGIFCAQSRSFVLFAPVKHLQYRLKDLNRHFLKEGDRVRIINEQDENGLYNKIFIISGIVPSYGQTLNGPFYVVRHNGSEFTYIRSELHFL